MEYFHQFLINLITTSSLELVAAISGSYYLSKNLKNNTANKLLVYFLWFTFFFDLGGSYSAIAYFSNYEYFGFVYDTVFKDNYWWFNMYMLISYSFFVYYFSSFLIKNKVKKRIKLLILFYLIIGVINLIFSDIFFKGNSIFSTISGTIIILFSIFLFYFELLKSDKVLRLIKYLPIYISIGVLVFYLCVTPIDLFSQYFKRVNELFVNVKAIIYLIANIFMYTTFTIGFLVCAKKNNNTNELNE